MIRTFLALPLEIQASLRTTCSDLKIQFSKEKLRWVNEENIHLTIRFFGDVKEDQIGQITAVVSSALYDVPASEISLKGLGTFENSSSYHVLWAGIKDQSLLHEIKGRIDEALNELLPIKIHRRYHPHLTLARMKRIYDRERFLEEISRYSTSDFGSYRLDRLVLFQSILGERGPVYKELHEIILK